MDLNHPVAIKMKNLGCSYVKTSMAFLTYIELCEVYAKKNVDFAFNQKLDLIYITTEEKYGKKDVYVPFYCGGDVAIAELENLCVELVKDESTDLYICLRELDTTTVFYKLTNGLAPPLSPESVTVMKAKAEERQFEEQEFMLNKRKIYSRLKMQERLISQPSDSQIEVITVPSDQVRDPNKWLLVDSNQFWEEDTQEMPTTVISLPETDDSCEVIEIVTNEQKQGETVEVVDDSPIRGNDTSEKS